MQDKTEALEQYQTKHLSGRFFLSELYSVIAVYGPSTFSLHVSLTIKSKIMLICPSTFSYYNNAHLIFF